jgi:tetratricopeptide (TPR) repeat protein
MLAAQAEAAAFSGRLRRARDLYEQAAELARRRGFRERAATLTALGALTEAEVGFYRRAQTKARRAAGRGSSARAPAVLALARSGEVRRSQLLADELARRSPEDTVLHAVALPTIRGHISVHEGQPVAALDLLQAARPYELGVTREFPDFASLYVRGQAYLLAGRAAEAADEFQRIIDNRGLDPVSPFYALAHLRLARAHSLAGDTDGQKRAYRDFLALWEDADPDIPLLQEAKAEYGKLQD